MNKRRLPLSLGLLAPLAALFLLGAADPAPRIVTVGASPTELVYALGSGEHIVATDTSSLFPAEAQKLPKIGYHRNLAVEGVLSLRPTLLVATDEAGPPGVIAQLRSTGIPVVLLPTTPTVAGHEEKIRLVGKALNATKAADALIAKNRRLLAAQPKAKKAPKTLFVYARGNGALMVSGRDTSADGIITLAGGTNAITGYDGYKPLNAEALIAAQPEVILIPARALSAIGGIDGLKNAPGVALTPAGKKGRLVPVDDVLMLGFGPRLPEAVSELSKIIHAESK